MEFSTGRSRRTKRARGVAGCADSSQRRHPFRHEDAVRRSAQHLLSSWADMGARAIVELELPEYLLLALIAAVGVAVRHWWQHRHRVPWPIIAIPHRLRSTDLPGLQPHEMSMYK